MLVRCMVVSFVDRMCGDSRVCGDGLFPRDSLQGASPGEEAIGAGDGREPRPAQATKPHGTKWAGPRYSQCDCAIL